MSFFGQVKDLVENADLDKVEKESLRMVSVGRVELWKGLGLDKHDADEVVSVLGVGVQETNSVADLILYMHGANLNSRQELFGFLSIGSWLNEQYKKPSFRDWMKPETWKKLHDQVQKKNDGDETE